MIQSLQTQEGQEDLRIVEHLDMQKLPESVQQMISLASTPEEQDIILMATLAAASACVPNLYFTYGPTGKKYYANLQCFILAAAASGKGIANQALEMVRVIDEQYPLLVAGDSTLPAWYRRWKSKAASAICTRVRAASLPMYGRPRRRTTTRRFVRQPNMSQ